MESLPPLRAPNTPREVTTMRKGVKTTEFWLTLATNLGALTATIADAVPPRYTAIAIAISTGLYALSRGWAKSGPGTIA